MFMLFTFTSCVTTSSFINDDPVQKVYVSTSYYDYNNGISIVYINKTPYYQYYDIKGKYWYRKPVPYYRHHYIKQRPNYHKPKPNYQNHNRPTNKPRPNYQNHNRPTNKPSPMPDRSKPQTKSNIRNVRR